MVCHVQAIAEAIAKERAATAAMLQAAAAAQQPAFQSRPAPAIDSRVPASHLSRLRQQQSTDQQVPFTRSRLGSHRHQQGVYESHDSSHAAVPAARAVPRFAPRQTNGFAHEVTPVGLGTMSGAADGWVETQCGDDLREGFRKAVSAFPEEFRHPLAKADDPMSCSINHVLPHVASWGNLSNHSSGSNSGLQHSSLHENTSRGLPTFDPISTPAGLFNSNSSTSGDKGSFPSYLASIWSSDAKSGGLSGSPNSHFEPSPLNHNH